MEFYSSLLEEEAEGALQALKTSKPVLIFTGKTAGGYFIASPTGLEQINVTTPSGNASNPYSQWVYLNQIRNSSGLQLVAAGTTVTTAVPSTTGTLLASGAITTQKIVAEAKRQGMITLRQDGIMKALDGITLMEEVIRETEEV